MYWAYKRDNVYNTISDAFEQGALVTGMSLLGVWLDRSSDPASGDIKVTHQAFNSFMMDGFFRKQDLSDCNFIWTRKWLTPNEAAFLYPDRQEEILKMRPPRYNKDQRFYFMPENYNFTIKDLIPYDEFWYQDYRTAHILYDTQTGEVIEWKGKKDENLKFYLAKYPQVKYQSIKKQTAKLAIVINEKVFYDGPNPLKIDKYPFVPVLSYWDPDNIYLQWRLQGVVRGLRDAQFLYNRRKIIELDMLESQINSGMKVIEGSLVDNNDVLKTGQGQPIFVKASAPMGLDSVQQIPPPAIPPTTLQLAELLSKEIQEISGVNEELLGSAVDDKAGVLSMLRQGAGLVTLEKLFDQLDLSQKILGEITMEVIQNNFTPGKIKRILNKEPTEQFFDKNFGKYDCAVAEGLLTDTQQQLNFLGYSQLAQMGLPIPPDLLIDSAPIHGKKELKEKIMQNMQQQQQVAQKREQLEQQQIAVDTQTKQSYSEAQHSLAAERIAKIQLDKAVNAERINRAEEDRTAGVLNLVKALKELQGMDLEHLMTQVTILKELEGEEHEETETKSKENREEASTQGHKGSKKGNK